MEPTVEGWAHAPRWEAEEGRPVSLLTTGGPDPDSIARRLFDEATIEAHLDHLAGSQADNGGWTFNWPAWSPVAASEWRGSITVDALRTLRANGRL